MTDAVTKMTGALTRTALACLTWTKTDAVLHLLNGLLTTKDKEAAANPETFHAATLIRMKHAERNLSANTKVTP